ncbi:MAG TPA: DUF4270 family protein [Niabella sp.]|nr:DUF4270 family protein [Niabella sp.]HOZ98164.1 DUF4270 family protein [Niabella sp.]HQW16060.1 DUF4270 family protein [Niabella sp.]HQX21272.1 DUF4270 family protein [Niabella sp.]HQX41971.1 DUF4270 family protein [Niabella sp.]
MNKYFLSALAVVFAITATFISCNKINLPTELGQELIPTIDNINTFDTSLEVETYNKIFSFADDSARSIYSDEQFLGQINNDPIFGKTNAQMFFQFTPENGKLTFKNGPGKRYIDSVVLIVKYIETYGDSSQPQSIEVSELSAANNFKASGSIRDSAYSIRENNFITTSVLGSRSVLPTTLDDSTIDIRTKDTIKVARQLRIKLNSSFGQRLLNYDTTGVNDAYSTDSIFLTKFAGFALKSVGGGNAIMGFNLNDTTTRLSVYYRYDNVTTAGDIDTAVANFYLAGKVATANFIGRDYTGTQIAATANDQVKDPLVYIQNGPGAYANLKVPGLSGLKAGIIHLAEFQMEEVYDAQDSLFYAAPLFMDMVDSATGKYKTIPMSIENAYLAVANSAYTLFSISSAGYGMFGSRPFYKKDPLGNLIKQWRFNVTRYVQGPTGLKFPKGDFRLYTSPYMIIQNGNPGTTNKIVVQSTGAFGRGRIRLGGGNHNTQKMKLRVVYSKL